MIKLSDIKYFIIAIIVVGLFIGNLYLMAEIPLYGQIILWTCQGLMWLGLIFSISLLIKCTVEGKFYLFRDD